MANKLIPNLNSTPILLLDWTLLPFGGTTKTFWDWILGDGVIGPTNAMRLFFDFIEGSVPSPGTKFEVFQSAQFAGNVPSSAWNQDAILYGESPSHSLTIANGNLNSTLDTTASVASAVLSVVAHGGIAAGDRIMVETGSGATQFDEYTVISVDTSLNDITVERNADSAYPATSTNVRKIHSASIALDDKAIATTRVLASNLAASGTDARIRVQAMINKGWTQAIA